MKFLEEKLNYIRGHIGDGLVSDYIRYHVEGRDHLIIDDQYEWAYVVVDIPGGGYDMGEVDYDEAVEKFFEGKKGICSVW